MSLNFVIRPQGLLIALLMISAAVSNAFGQEKEKDIYTQETHALLYVYAFPAETTLNKVEPMVYLDNKEIAEIRPGRYFIVYVEPGDRTVEFKKSKRRRGGAQIEFEAGKSYYLRVNWKSGFTVRPESFDLVAPEVGAYDLKQLRPIDKGNIKNKEIVRLSLTNES